MSTSKKRLGSGDPSTATDREKDENLRRLVRKGLKAAFVLSENGDGSSIVRLYEASVDATRRVHILAVRRAIELHRQGKDPVGENYLKEWLR